MKMKSYWKEYKMYSDLNISFEKYISFLRTSGKSNESIRSYSITYSLYSKTGFKTISNDEVSVFLERYPNPATYNKALAHIQSFANWWIKSQGLKATELIQNFTLQQKKIKLDLPILVRSFEEILFREKLQEQSEKSLAFFDLLRTTGLRFMEVWGLTLDQYYEPDTGIHAIKFHGKGNRERLVPLNDVAYGAFLIWTAPESKKPVPTTIRYHFNRAKDKSGHKINPHWIRHTVATKLLTQGYSYDSISNLLGNSVEVCKQRYAATNHKQLKEMVCVL